MLGRDPSVILSSGATTPGPDRAALRYWTAARLARVRPLPLPKVHRPRATLPTAGPNLDPTAPVFVEPVPPDGPDGRLASVPRCTTERVTDPALFPYSVVGKLFFTIGDRDVAATAWVVGERAIFTAGHCLFDHEAGAWATNVMFKARFANGAAAGTWAIGRLAAPAGWVEGEDFSLDFGVGLASAPVRPVTGKAGYVANYPTDLGPFRAIGYPSEPSAGVRFDGKTMWGCRGGYVTDPACGPGLVAMHSNLTGGAGGGCWVTDRFGPPVVCGVNSFRYTSQPHVIRSPYFGEGFLRLIRWMQENGGDDV